MPRPRSLISRAALGAVVVALGVLAGTNVHRISSHEQRSDAVVVSSAQSGLRAVAARPPHLKLSATDLAAMSAPTATLALLGWTLLRRVDRPERRVATAMTWHQRGPPRSALV